MSAQHKPIADLLETFKDYPDDKAMQSVTLGMLREMQRERDELLSVLVSFTLLPSIKKSYPHRYAAARAAIAKATGGTS